MSITVFLVSEHGSTRALLRILLEMHLDLVVAGDAPGGKDTVDAIAQCCPDVIVLDLGLPVRAGLALVREMLAVCPGARVILLAMYATNEHVHRVLTAGVCGFVLKEAVGDELAEAIRTVHGGKGYLSARLVEHGVNLSALAHFVRDGMK